MNRIAVIVIGSNSTRSLCCDETPALSHPMRGRVETRLLLHLNKENPMLTDEAIALLEFEKSRLTGRIRFIALLAGGVSQLYEQIQYESARLVGLYATSAVRDAQNAQALSATLESLCGQPLRVLSGREEAAYSFYGAAGDWPRAGMIDIGGGSTEIALGSGDTLAHAYSLQLGASRLHKRQPINSPYDIAMALSIAAEIAEPLHALQRETERLPFCLVGGTGTSVAQILAAQTGRADIEGMRLERQAVETLLGQIAATPRNQRESIPGFPAGRADILPTGMAALIAVMDALSLDHLQVTQRGNTDGLLRAFVHKKFA